MASPEEHEAARQLLVEGQLAQELRTQGEQMATALVRREQELRASDELFRLLVESTTDYAIFMLDPQGNVVTWNTGAERTKGYRADEIIGQNLSHFYSQEDIRQGIPEQNLKIALAEGRCEDTGWRIRKDGSRFWANVVITALRDESGALRGFSKITRDITDKRQAEEYARQLLEEETKRKAAEEYAKDIWEQREQLRVTLRSIGDGVIATDAKGRVTLFNPVAQQLTGCDEAIGLPLEEVFRIVNEDTHHTVKDFAKRTLVEGVLVGLPTHTLLTAKDGTERRIADSVAPIRDETGKTTGAVIVFRDFTAQQKAENDLRLRDRAIQAVSQGILITDPTLPDNPIIYVSPGFERITGYSAEECIGKNCRFLQGADTDRESVRRLREAIRERRSCDVEILNYRKNGTPFWTDVSISPVFDNLRNLSHFVGVQSDVTERRSLAEQLRQSQKMEAVGRLAGGVAHDFNNLLTVILGCTEYLKEDDALSSDSRELASEIEIAGRRAGKLTNQLLAFSRQQVLKPKVVNLNDVISGMEQMLARLIGEDVALKSKLLPRVSPTRVDVGQIEQVLMNLAVNARDAMPQGGSLTIETANVELDSNYAETNPEVTPGAYAMLAVMDTGCGMDSQTKARIFEPFFTTKEISKGTGLGLSTVFGIVKQSGGHVTVYSEPGQGTMFKLYFPAVEAALTSKSEEEPQTVPARGTETVLLVEDDEMVRSFATRILRMQGYTVLEASNGKDAILAFERHLGPVHLVLTDVVMPNMSGRELSEKLRRVLPDIKVLFMSGYTDDAVVRHGVIETESHFIQKPFTTVALARTVRGILDK